MPGSPPAGHTAAARGRRWAAIGLLANLGLAVVKLLAGLLGHSYALIADAVESMADLIGSAVIWGGLHIAARPADEDHPYGHGKAEALAALIVAMMVLAAGAGIAVKAVAELLTPHSAPALFTLWVLVAVIIVKTALFLLVRRAGQGSGLSAVRTDAWHHVSDALTSGAALIGIGIAVRWGYAGADAIAALFASGIIMVNGALLFRAPVHDLMDKEPAEVVGRARRIAESVPGVVNTEKMAARSSGGLILIDMHLGVDPAMSVREAHALSHRVKDAVRAGMPRVAEVLIHIEPVERA